VGVTLDDTHLSDLFSAGVNTLSELLDGADPRARIRELLRGPVRTLPVADATLLCPVEHQEVWAAGVTYLRSKKARMEESDFSATAYDRVYEAARPEIFFKSPGPKVVGPDEWVGIRQDARWNVPEPELVLVLNRHQRWVGCSLGNDMSSRDIEGENLLYLPQAKTYRQACAVGPWITLETREEVIRQWTLGIRIEREGSCVFEGETSLSNIKRSFPELMDYLCRSQVFPEGALLLTGTGVVPPNDFTLAEGDEIIMDLSGVGTLRNRVAGV
jgi:2-dehydro-3-deoxy-D-arabinonate dehydratase